MNLRVCFVRYHMSILCLNARLIKVPYDRFGGSLLTRTAEGGRLTYMPRQYYYCEILPPIFMPNEVTNVDVHFVDSRARTRSAQS
jgi:hypothetical protein